jgi:hypothetical protein
MRGVSSIQNLNSFVHAFNVILVSCSLDLWSISLPGLTFYGYVQQCRAAAGERGQGAVDRRLECGSGLHPLAGAAICTRTFNKPGSIV